MKSYEDADIGKVDNVSGVQPRSGNTALSQSEEAIVASLLVRYAERGIPLNNGHLTEAVEVLV